MIIKITSLAGAYWRGDEKRKQLTRIYAVSFPKKKELDEYKKELRQELCSAYSEVYHQVGKDLIDAIEEEINVRKEK